MEEKEMKTWNKSMGSSSDWKETKTHLKWKQILWLFKSRGFTELQTRLWNWNRLMHNLGNFLVKINSKDKEKFHKLMDPGIQPKDHFSDIFYFLFLEMAIHSSTLAWKIPWMEEPDRLGVGYDWATSLLIILSHWLLTFHVSLTSLQVLNGKDGVLFLFLS